jgi:hypothetical protein
MLAALTHTPKTDVRGRTGSHEIVRVGAVIQSGGIITWRHNVRVVYIMGGMETSSTSV